MTDARPGVTPRTPAWSPRVTICLPTYQERENIEPMLRTLEAVLSGAAVEATVLVIDDASPDGTGEIADRCSASMPFVRVIHRNRKAGLGPAYVAGFRRALEDGADLIFEMDCDFSHDPHDIPRLIEAAQRADLVLGSRYVVGGGVRDWGLARRALSRGGSLYAAAVLGLRIRDLTGGFKCFRRPVLEALDLDRVASTGYAFQVEMTYRAVRAGFRVAEVPIVFAERKRGTSKMSARIALEAAWQVPVLPARRWLAAVRPATPG